MLNLIDIKAQIRQAYLYAEKSSLDNNTQVGAIIIHPDYIYAGTNSFTSHFQNKPENLIRERKYPRMEHAERVAIFNAMREQGSLKNAILICPWATCAECARAIVLSGIKTVWAHKGALDRTTVRWKESFAIGREILEDGDVEYNIFSGKINNCQNKFDGVIWNP